VTRTARDRVIIFDFDGTITVGDGPVLAYAAQVAKRLAPGIAVSFRAAVATGLHGETSTTRTTGMNSTTGATTTTTTPTSSTVLTADPVDDYDLVRQVALDHGADTALLSAAYLASRELLATEQASIAAPVLEPARGTRAPDDLASWLRRLSTQAYLVLATNAPSTGLDRALAVLGVTDAFDEVRTSVGKPDGMHALVDEMLARGPVLSVGDVWHNDLEPVWARGAATALLTRAGAGDARATYRADTLGGLAPSITAWASAAPDPHQPHHAHPVQHLTSTAPSTAPTTAKADL